MSGPRCQSVGSMHDSCVDTGHDERRDPGAEVLVVFGEAYECLVL